MPGIDPSTLADWLSGDLVDPDAIAGTNGVAIGPHNGYAVPGGGFTAPTYVDDCLNGHAGLRFSSAGMGSALWKNLATVGSPPNSSGGAFPAGLTLFAVVKPTALHDLGVQHWNDRRNVVGLNRIGEESGSLGLRNPTGTTTHSKLRLARDASGWFWDVPNNLAVYPVGSWALVGFRTDGTNVKSYKGLSQDRSGTNPDAPTYGQYVSAFTLGNDLYYGGRALDGDLAYFGGLGRMATDEEWAGIAVWVLDRFALPLREIDVAAFVGTAGKDVFVSFRSAITGAGAYVTADAIAGVGYKVNGGSLVTPSPLFRKYGDNGENSCNVVVLPASTTIQPGDSVTVTVPPGAIPTTQGYVDDLADHVATNHAGEDAILPQTVPSERTMKVAYNFNTDGNYFQPVTAYKNFFKTAYIANESGLEIAEDGTVTSAPYGTTYLLRAVDSSKPWPGYPGARYGRYRVRWDGPAGSLLTLVNYSGIETDAETVITHVPELDDLAGTTKQRFFDVTPAATAPGQRPLFSLHQSAHAPLTNVWVGLAEYDPDDGTYFDDLILEKLANASSIRFMDAMQTNFANVAHVNELTLATDERYTVQRRRTVAVSRIEAYDGAAFWPSDTRQFWKVTTAAPHGLARGQTVTLKGPSNGPINVELVDRGWVNLHDALVIGIWWLSDTEFAFAEYGAGAHKATATAWTTAGATFTMTTVCGMPVEMMAALVDETGAEYCHVTIPHPATDATITNLTGRLATSLPSGVKLRLEMSNEPWNFAFSQFVHWAQESVRRGGGANEQSYVRGYVVRAFESLAIARAAFVAAERPSTDVELVLNVQNSAPDQTAAVAARVVSDGLDNVEGVSLVVAPYMPATPWGRLSGKGYETWSLERMMDHHEAFAASHDAAEKLYEHRDELDAAGLTSWGLGTYECQFGFMGMSPGDPESPQTDVNYEPTNRQSIACSFHPRTYGITAKRFADLQAAGAAFNTIYNMFHGFGYEFPGHGVSNYGDYPGLASVAGTGDGSDGGVDNRPYLVDEAGLPAIPTTLKLASVRGRVALDWAGGGTAGPSYLTASWATVTSPRETPVASLALTFSESVEGVAKGGITLTRSGSSVSLAAAELSGSGASYVLSGLTDLTTAAGTYVLTLSKTGIEGTDVPEGEEAPRVLASNVSRVWTTTEPTPPPDPGPSGHRYFGGALSRLRRYFP